MHVFNAFSESFYNNECNIPSTNHYFALLSLLFFSHPCMSFSVLSNLSQCLTGIQAINGMQAIYEPFEVIYIQAFMVSYVRLSLAVLGFAYATQ